MRQLALAAAIGALLATPSLAQTIQQPVEQRDTVPVQLPQRQIKGLQRTLNAKGFSVGRVDGLWGPNTANALKRFQASNQLNPTGELDRTTELKLGMVKPSNQVATPTLAPTPTAPSAPPPPVAVMAAPPPAAVMAAPPPAVVAPSAPGASTPVASAPVAPASSTASAGKQPRPTSGANSFTKEQASARILGDGYQDVRDLALDNRGIWRGMAIKGGQPVHVWLDYQGDVGQQ